MIAQPVTFVWSQCLRWTIASALKDLILTVGALTKSGRMECDSRNNGGNFVRTLTFFCWLVHMTDIFPPLGFSLHPNNHCDIPGKTTEIEYRGKCSYNYASVWGFSYTAPILDPKIKQFRLTYNFNLEQSYWSRISTDHPGDWGLFEMNIDNRWRRREHILTPQGLATVRAPWIYLCAVRWKLLSGKIVFPIQYLWWFCWLSVKVPTAYGG